MANGISGLCTRRSLTRNTISSATDASRSRIVRVDPQPTNGALDIVYTNSARPPVTVTAPSGSKDRSAVTTRLSGTIGLVTAKTSAPTGTLTSKIHAHHRYFGNPP